MPLLMATELCFFSHFRAHLVPPYCRAPRADLHPCLLLLLRQRGEGGADVVAEEAEEAGLPIRGVILLLKALLAVLAVPAGSL